MKKNFLSYLLVSTILSVSSLATPSYAKEEAPRPAMHEEFEKPEFNHEEMRQKMADKMADKLELTKEQREQAKKVREQGRKEIEPLMKKMKEIRKELDIKREANMKEFEKILTPDQKKKFEEMKKHKPHFGKDKRHHKGKPDFAKKKDHHRKPMDD